MQTAEFRNLIECQGGVFNKPYGGGFGHKNLAHNSSFNKSLTGDNEPHRSIDGAKLNAQPSGNSVGLK
jgi:hypothetical protein